MSDEFFIVDAATGVKIHMDADIAAKALHDAGWTVFPPTSPAEALALMDLHDDSIADLLARKDADEEQVDPDPVFPLESTTPPVRYAMERKGRHRAGDHATSVQGAHDVVFRAGSQLHRLLVVYASAVNTGLTDEQAAERAGLLGSCWWKRSGELRQDGLIEQVLDADGREVTRAGRAGVQRIVCRITSDGVARLSRLKPV